MTIIFFSLITLGGYLELQSTELSFSLLLIGIFLAPWMFSSEVHRTGQLPGLAFWEFFAVM